MQQYEGFAQLYDMLMDEVDYDQWTANLIDLWKQNKIEPKNILECACGTGEITTRLAKAGYKITGLDISYEMLAVAEEKSRKQKLKIPYIQQNMVDLQYNKKVDTVLCMCDGVNYILEETDLQKFFQKVYDLLEEKGLFLFDISSHYKLSTLLGQQTFFYEKENVCYAWENYFDEEQSLVTMDLNFFIEHKGSYERLQETHVQRAYTQQEIKTRLKKAGFGDITVYEHLTHEEPKPNSERLLFVAKK